MQEEKQALMGFNVRVYGICVQNQKMLTLKEKYGNWDMLKLPGGGLEFGEGLVDCLKRECKEELNLEIKIGDVFYVQENYVPSLMNDQKQIVIIYFWMELLNREKLQIKDPHIEAIVWTPLTAFCPLTLPVDKMMYEKLVKHLGIA